MRGGILYGYLFVRDPSRPILFFRQSLCRWGNGLIAEAVIEARPVAASSRARGK